MDKIMQGRIKELIVRHPKVGDVLAEFGVACVTCAVGTCLLKDILEIHRLAPEDEQRMLTRIAEIVYPDRKVVVPLRKSEPQKKTGEPFHSPPLRKLVEEHALIKRVLARIPGMLRQMDLDTTEGRQLALASVDFIRSFADKCHHAKEEDILFKCFDGNLDIIKVMLDDHETGRAHVRAIRDAIERRDTAAAVKHLKGYRQLLTEHIRKEDEVLYPWMDRQLSDTEIGRLFSAFAAADAPMAETRRRSQEFISMLEQRFGDAERGPR